MSYVVHISRFTRSRGTSRPTARVTEWTAFPELLPNCHIFRLSQPRELDRQTYPRRVCGVCSTDLRQLATKTHMCRTRGHRLVVGGVFYKSSSASYWGSAEGQRAMGGGRSSRVLHQNKQCFCLRCTTTPNFLPIPNTSQTWCYLRTLAVPKCLTFAVSILGACWAHPKTQNCRRLGQSASKTAI